MKKEDCFYWGEIIKPIGIRGECLIIIDADDPYHYEDLKSVLLEINGHLVPHFVENISMQAEKITLRLKGIMTIEAAERMRNTPIYLPLTLLPKLKEGEFYLHQIADFEVIDESLGILGKVESIYDMPAHDLMGITYKGKEVLIPIQDAFVKKYDWEQKKIYVTLPEGFVEVYLEDAEEDEKDED